MRLFVALALLAPLALAAEECVEDEWESSGPKEFGQYWELAGLGSIAINEASSTDPSAADNSMLHWYENTFQAFWSPGFAGGGGIAMVTSPKRREYFIDLQSHQLTTSPIPPFVERQIPGKGRGLVGYKTLYRGDQILAESPILLVDPDLYHASADEWPLLLRDAVDHLPAETADKFWQLHGQPVKEPIGGRIDRNSVTVTLTRSCTTLSAQILL